MARSLALFLFLSTSLTGLAQNQPLDRNGQTVVIEPYGPSIVRVSLSMIAKEAEAEPGYGIIAKPQLSGWQHTANEHGEDIYKSDRMTVTIAAAYKHDPNQKL